MVIRTKQAPKPNIDSTVIRVQPKEAITKFKKIGGGTFIRANGERIKSGQTFSAIPSEIPVAFRDTIIPLDGHYPIKGEEKVEPVVPDYQIVEEPPGSDNWKVLNEKGKAVSEGDLTHQEAEELVFKLKG